MLRVQNPVLPGFHPDPSFLCVDDTYYIANSTFEWYPGVEIHRSRDLVAWEKVKSPLSEKRLLHMAGNKASCGIWAPCLSRADGLFWLIYTNVRTCNSFSWKDTPNYLVTASSIEGPWSDPVYLNSSGFDPSLFHDGDGRKWLVNMEWDYRKTNLKQFSGIIMQEYLPAKKSLAGPVFRIFPGSETGMVEGPHLYRRNGFYYLAVAEGGTGYGHALTVARSRQLEGPYELHPFNPVITSYGHDGCRLKKAGHASWCDSPDGRTYVAFLCSRPLPGTDKCVLGRETAICEMIWRDDWPWLKPQDGDSVFCDDGTMCNAPHDDFEPPVIDDTCRAVKRFPSATVSVRYDFNVPEIHSDFKNLREERDPGRYSLDSRPGYLRMRGGQSPISAYGQSLLARRQTDFCFAAETCMEFAPEYFQQLAGLCWRYNEDNQYLAAVTIDDTDPDNPSRSLAVLTFINGVYIRSNEIRFPYEGPIWLGLTVRFHTGRFRYSLDGIHWKVLRPDLDASYLSDDNCRGFTGAFTGMFCVDTQYGTATADFRYFDYRVL